MVRETILIVVLLVGLLLAAGCMETSTGGQDNSAGNIRTHYDYQESWGITAGCYGKVT
jgi:hypothetical protein